MAVTVQESGSVSTISNTTAQFTAGAGVANDDLWIMSADYNQPSYVPGTPSGWTAFSNGIVSPSASMQAKAFWKWAVTGDSSSPQGWLSGAWATAARKGITWHRLRGVDKAKWNAMTDAQRLASVSELNDVSTAVPALGVSGGDFVTVSQWLERSSTPTASGTITYPSGYTAGSNSFGTGGGTCNAAAAHNLTPQTSSVGSGAWGSVGAGGVAVYTFAVPVASANAAPTANAGADQAVDAWAPVTLSGSGSDSDGTIASYGWAQISGPPVSLSGSGANRTFEAPGTIAGATLTFRLTVTDNGGATGTDDITVTVAPCNERAVIGGAEVPMRVSVASST